MGFNPKLRTVGRPRRVEIRDLINCVGYRLLTPIRGARGKILMDVGEVLTKTHTDRITEWERRPGMGRLSLYTRIVEVVLTNATGDDRPIVEGNPEEAHWLHTRYNSHR